MSRAEARSSSRAANAFARFSNLALFIDRERDAHAALDLVCLDRKGRPRFHDLMFGRCDPAYLLRARKRSLTICIFVSSNESWMSSLAIPR